MSRIESIMEDLKELFGGYYPDIRKIEEGDVNYVETRGPTTIDVDEAYTKGIEKIQVDHNDAITYLYWDTQDEGEDE